MKAGRVDKARLRMALQMLQTTSPSYVLMASLDVARLQMAVSGRKMLGRVIDMARETAKVLNRVPGVKCFGPEHCGGPGVFQFDQLRLLVHFDWAVTGFEVAHRLRRDFKLQAEMADVQNVLFLVGQGNTWAQMKRLARAVRNLERQYRGLHASRMALPLPSLENIKTVLTPREALFGRTRRVPLSEAAGAVSGELLCPYPPGIPLLAPGEYISKDMVEYLAALVRSGGRVNGQADVSGRFVRIVEAPLSAVSREVDFDKMLAFVLNENAPGTDAGKRGSS
jgi:arginine/lysine/ornithine decarboxylase